MNIYLDIDGVLLINEKNASPFADEFLEYILNKYPDSTYWLSTHCWRGKNRTIELLSPVLKPETIKLLTKVKPTEWGDYKTDGIDFTKPFLWFDDDLFPEEETVLREKGVFDSWIEVNLTKDVNTLRELITNLPNFGKGLSS